MMTNEQKAEAYLMILNGASYEEAAQKFGVTRQRLHQLLPGVGNSKKQPNGWMYPNIKRWMKDNRILAQDFAKLIGCSSVTVGKYLSGKAQPNKQTIDKILEVTGMTYEEAFKQ